MDIQTLLREFRYNGVVLADPNQTFTLPQVRDFYANVYPEIVSADIEGPAQLGAKIVYTFRRAVGTKGGLPVPADVQLHLLVHDLAAPLQANWMLAGDAQFIKDVGETLREVGASAISAGARERLASLHREYCQLQAA